MRLYLVQHGESLSKAENPDRPLSDRGRHDAEKLAAFLAKADVRVGRLYHSGKTRAAQTAELLQGVVAPKQRAEAKPGFEPNDPTEPAARELAASVVNAMVVGHLPFLGKLVSRLVVGREDVGTVVFAPGSLVCLEKGENGGWGILWMVRPELLRG